MDNKRFKTREELEAIGEPVDSEIGGWNHDWNEDWMIIKDPLLSPVDVLTENDGIITPEEYLARFKEIQARRYEITKIKNSDYTADCGDALQNFKLVELLNITSVEVGLMTRISDKWARLVGLCHDKECQVKDEKYTDTIDDMCNYLTILQIYLENKQLDNNSDS